MTQVEHLSVLIFQAILMQVEHLNILISQAIHVPDRIIVNRGSTKYNPQKKKVKSIFSEPLLCETTTSHYKRVFSQDLYGYFL